MKAALLISHGSRSRQARLEVEALAARLKNESGWPAVGIAFLDVEEPTIPQGVEALARQGATEITALLNFLNSGNHVLNDIPAILDQARAAHPQLSIRLTPPIGAHPRIPELFLEVLRA